MHMRGPTSVLAIALLLVGATSNPGRAQPPGTPLANRDALRQTAMNSGGDAKRGEGIYLSAAAQCPPCHKVLGRGGDLGPDLSQVGGKFDRTHLIESILDPSAQVPEGFHATTISTTAGRFLTGIVKPESATDIVLVDVEGKRLPVPVQDVESRAVSKVSLMPSGLA